jgi:uncharacterized membrane protein (UPF0182 family)
MSADLEAHLRYPQDLFRMQSDVYGKYHVTEARRFYQGNERWLRSPSPTIITGLTGVGGTNGSTRGAQRSPEITATTPRQEPYYLNIQLPGDDSSNFVLLQPYVPVSKDNQLTRLASFLTVKSDPGAYGRLESFVMPIGVDVRGPVQVANAIESDPTLSAQFTLLRGGGSTVIKGNIQLIPVGGSLIYVQPVYVQQSGAQGYPQFQFVVVFNQGALAPAQGPTVNDALNRLFNLTPTTPTTPTTPGAPTTSTTTPPTTAVPGGQSVQQLVAQAQAKLRDADAARLAGNLGLYQQLVSEARQLIDQAAQRAAGN